MKFQIWKINLWEFRLFKLIFFHLLPRTCRCLKSVKHLGVWMDKAGCLRRVNCLQSTSKGWTRYGNKSGLGFGTLQEGARTSLLRVQSVYATWSQRKRTTKEHLEKRSGDGDVDSRIQLQLEEDGGGSIGQSWRWRTVLIGLCSARIDDIQKKICFKILWISVLRTERWQEGHWAYHCMYTSWVGKWTE